MNGKPLREVQKLLRLQPHPEVRGLNGFREMDAVALNQGCEAMDTIALTQEIRAGRRADLFTIAGIGFNALGTVTWLRSRRLMR